MQAIQADVVAARCPVLRAVDHAGARARRPQRRAGAGRSAAPSRVPEAVHGSQRGSSPHRRVSRRLRRERPDGVLGTPTGDEIADSVAATIYSVWRGQFIRDTIDATLEGVPLPPGITLPKPAASSR